MKKIKYPKPWVREKRDVIVYVQDLQNGYNEVIRKDRMDYIKGYRQAIADVKRLNK